MDALIGYTGFVGETLLRQREFDCKFRSTNIDAIRGGSFDWVICSAAPAQKWIANREPEADLRNIESLIDRLESIQCRRFVLISTVDVFKQPIGVDEDHTVDESGLHAYGLHRRLLEKFVARLFPAALIVRLPGLIGPRLRKNALYDLLHHNNLDAVDSRGVFQFYPMVNLWADIRTAADAGLTLVHLTAEPISLADAAQQGFGVDFKNTLANPPARYDLQSKHAALFGGSGAYTYSRRDSILAMRAYAQSEPVAPAEAPRA